jgi:hypothetical protein
MDPKKYLRTVFGLIIFGLLEIIVGIAFIASGYNTTPVIALLIKGPILLVVAAFIYRGHRRNNESQTTPTPSNQL